MSDTTENTYQIDNDRMAHILAGLLAEVLFEFKMDKDKASVTVDPESLIRTLVGLELCREGCVLAKSMEEVRDTYLNKMIKPLLIKALEPDIITHLNDGIDPGNAKDGSFHDIVDLFMTTETTEDGRTVFIFRRLI